MPDRSFDVPDPGLSKLLELFDGPLAEVKFPDVDAAMLAEDAEAVRRSTSEVAAARSAQIAAQAALLAAEAALLRHESALLGRARRGLAYARVFAQGDAALSSELDRIALPGTEVVASDARTPSLPGIGFRKRGRPRKSRGESEHLAPVDEAQAASA